ncbi:YjbF family lipoprotein [Enterobacteriaceae bacterium LUAb1]
MRQRLLLPAILLLQACTSVQQETAEALKLSLFGVGDITLSNEQIKSMPYASMYARINDGPRIFVVLGFNEQGQQKWVAQDSTMIVMQHGRLVKTVGLADNLTDITNLEQDPLSQALNLTPQSRWTRILSWTENGQPVSATVTSVFSRQQDQVLDITGRKVPCRVYDEEVRAGVLDRHWINRFWINSSTGRVIQSKQMLGADYFPVENTVLKSAVSL